MGSCSILQCMSVVFICLFSSSQIKTQVKITCEHQQSFFHSHTLCKHSHIACTHTHSRIKPQTFLRKRDRFAVFLGGLAGMWEDYSGNTEPNMYVNIAYQIGCLHFRGFNIFLSLLRHAWPGTLITCSVKARGHDISLCIERNRPNRDVGFPNQPTKCK